MELRNASGSVSGGGDPDANVRALKVAHSQKASPRMAISELGSEIDVSDWHPRKGALRIRWSLEGDSNVTPASNEQPSKPAL
jgi:hypothetical protein